MTERHIAQGEEDEERGEENGELLINNGNIEAAEKQNILKKLLN